MRSLAESGATPTAEQWWSYRTACFRALGHDFAVRTTDAVLGRWLDGLFASLRVRSVPATLYGFVTDGPADRPYAVYADGELLIATEQPAFALRYLAWHVNQQAVARTTERVVVHAAGAERDGIGVLLSAESGRGKSTLVAGLVQSGFRYLTDEAVAVEPGTSLLQPFPKPIAVRPGSWQALAELRPDLDARLAPYVCEEWPIDPRSIRADAVAPPSAPGVVVFPRYVTGAPTQLERVRRVEAVRELVGQTFDFHVAGSRNLTVLADLVRACACYRLVVGDLADACELLHGLVDDLVDRKAAGDRQAEF